MTGIRPWLGGVALAVVGCATPPTHPPFSGAADDRALDPSVAPAKPYQKPVRMNGRGKKTSISFEDFFRLQQSGKLLIYDARPAFYYHLGHIPNAISVPRGTTDEQLSKREAEIKNAIASGKIVVTYCSGITCPDARTLADHISGFGYPVSIFSGGWHAWTAADMPTE